MNLQTNKPCPDCHAMDESQVDRRGFLQTVGSVASLASMAGLPLLDAVPVAAAPPTPNSAPETAVKAFYDSLLPEQRKIICFDWNHEESKRGILRTRVANNWQITPPTIDSTFYNKEQKVILHDIFKGLFNPEWYPKILKQLKDDTGGKPWGAGQSVAVFGKPGQGKFEFVMTGRHLTIRADGNSEDQVALGGPIFHGHAAESFNEKPNHPGNVFWHQALKANEVFKMLDGKQRQVALVKPTPHEAEVAFRGDKGAFPGIPVTEMSSDQKALVEATLNCLIEPYRQEDRDKIMQCLKHQGGLDKCSLAFYQDDDLGEDGVWDNWRLEGPSFVWYFRGNPHVHIWINVAMQPNIKLNADG